MGGVNLYEKLIERGYGCSPVASDQGNLVP